VAGDRTLSYADQLGPEARVYPCPFLVIAFDGERPTELPVRLSLAEVERLDIGRGPTRSWQRVHGGGQAVLQLSLADAWMSGSHAQLRRTDAGWRLYDEGSKNGTFVGGQRHSEVDLRDGDVIAVGSTLCVFRDGAPQQVGAPSDYHPASHEVTALTTWNPELAVVFEPVPRLAQSDIAVVIGGETGVGKEVLARHIHAQSGRKGAFIAINCGALPAHLIEGELFGAKKGAYSGATEDRPGLVRAAERGTLFLDEVAELPEPAQVKLLRVAQEREVTPLGGTRPIKVDVRIVAASHRALPAMVDQGSFRADLYARLAGAHVEIPPLRDRREDIGFLVGVVLRRWLPDRADGVRFEREAARALLRHSWRLNVRELEQCLRTACTVAGTERIGLVHLPEEVRLAAEALGPDDDGLERELIRLLGLHAGNVSAVARDLGKARVQIRRWCRRFGLDPSDYRAS